MKTVSDIVSAVGRPRIINAFGVSQRLIRLYIQNNSFPASWFATLEKMTGYELDRKLFSFKGEVK